MTISYQFDIASSKTWSFLKVICRWRGSVWKSVVIELFLWLLIYYIIFIIYRFFMNQEQQRFFAELANYTYSTTEYLPLTFMLGFFVKIVVDRWRDMFEHIGFIDSAAFTVANLIVGHDEESVLTRRNILRYLCLSQILLLRDISIKVRRRFPTIESVVQAGFAHEHEMRQMIETCIEDFYWMPIDWACRLSQKMREKGKIIGDPQHMMVLNSILEFQRNLQQLCNYDWVPVPIAYPQVVFMTIRVYFLICCISRQFIVGENGEIAKHRNFDLVFPFMTVLQFTFYMGWMKVAEALLNPFGEDDDDFESNFIIDRNVTIAMFVSNYPEMPQQKADLLHPELGLLYSERSMHIANNLLSNSVKKLELDKKDKTKRDDGTVQMVRKATVVSVNSAPTFFGRNTVTDIGAKKQSILLDVSSIGMQNGTFEHK